MRWAAIAVIAGILSTAQLLAAMWLTGACPASGARWRRHLAIHAVAGVLLSLPTEIGELAMRSLAGLDVRWTPDADALRHATSYYVFTAITHVVHFVRRQRRLLALHAHVGKRLTRLRCRGRDAEARALKAAQHPYLLAAALPSVSALLRRDPARAQRAIVGLGEELRATASRADDHEASLEEELATLGRLRPAVPPAGDVGSWGGKADELAIDPLLLEEPVPHLLLPSLVAIAEAAAAEGAVLTISARRTRMGAPELEVVARPDSCHASDGTRARETGKEERARRGERLRALTVERLRRAYGERGADLTIEAGPSAIVVRARLPLRAGPWPGRAGQPGTSDTDLVPGVSSWLAEGGLIRRGVDGTTAVTLLGASAALVGWLTLGDPSLRDSDALLRELAVALSLVATAAIVTLNRPLGARWARMWSAMRAHLLAALGVALVATGVHAIGIRPQGLTATSGPGPLALPLRALVWMLLYALIAGTLHAVVHAEYLQRVASAIARLRVLRIRSSSELRDAELRAIEDGLDPHLMGNALHTAASLVRRDVPLAQEVIGALASLAGDARRGRIAHEVPLAEELSTLRRLLPLEHARMRAVDGSLDVRWDIAPEALPALVPAMVLQPLVENAVRHGLAPRGGGWVLVRARPLGDDEAAGSAGAWLELAIVDDGVGATAYPDDGRMTGRAARGFGVVAVQRRLEALHGGRARLHLLPREGGGTIARLVLPLRTGGGTLPTHAGHAGAGR